MNVAKIRTAPIKPTVQLMFMILQLSFHSHFWLVNNLQVS